MRTVLQDVRYSFRTLWNRPGLPAVAVLTLALGISANSTVFSWINATLLDPIPGVARTSNMVTVMRGDRTDHPTPPFSYPDYRDLRDRNRSFSGLLAYHHDWVNLTGDGKPERIYAVLTSANYFDVLGVRPILGRSFAPAEESEVEGSAAVAVISYAFWQSPLWRRPFHHRPQNRGEPLRVYDYRGCSSRLSRMHARLAGRHLDSRDDGQAGLGLGREA